MWRAGESAGIGKEKKSNRKGINLVRVATPMVSAVASL